MSDAREAAAGTAATAPSPPLLVLEEAAIALPDATLLKPLSARAEGDSVGLVGDWSPFFRLLARQARLARGVLTIRGVAASDATRRGVVGLMLHDPPLPGSWNGERYLTEGARLRGEPRKKAQTIARELIRRFELMHFASRPLAALPLPHRRALLIANATLGEPAVLCCEAPLSRLDDAGEVYVQSVLERALAGRAGIVSVAAAPALGRERALLDRTSGVLVLAGGELVASGTPRRALAESPRAFATVTRRGDEFAAALSARGIAAERLGPVEALLGWLAVGAGTRIERFLVELPAPGDTRVILDAARASSAPLVELRLLELPRSG